MANYTLTHLHTMLSNGVTNIDSVTSFDQYIDRAKECGMTAMAFTEHGSVFEWINKKKHIEKAGMKYIHGMEAYVTETIAPDEEGLPTKIKDNYHCCLYARNYDGVLELNRLSSKSFNREDGHYYYYPRITFDELISTSDNIIVSTACLGGILNKAEAPLIKRFLHFLYDHKDRCFLEIQHHDVQDQIVYNRYLYDVHQKFGIPLIAGTDTHALDQTHMEARSVLQKAKDIRFDNEDGWDLTFKTYDELIAAYEKQNSIAMDVVREAIENTNRLADMIEPFELDTSYKYPHLWENSEKVFWNKIKAGVKQRGIDKYPNRDEYAKRIKSEFATYKQNGAIDFMLLMEDIISWCNDNDIKVGYGRGSCNGSVIAYVLGITEMDSLKFNLNFERFMNPERVSLADIDTDISPRQIDAVKNYIYNRHGLYCSDIITFNTIALKGAVRDVCRGLYRYSDTVNYLELTNKICDKVECNEAKMRKEYPEVFKYVDLLQGVIVSVGNHPCGLITSPFSIDDRLGLMSTKTDKYMISQVYMKEVDSLNYVKLDLLKLDTIELINDTCTAAGIERLVPDNIDTTDDKVWNSIRDDTTGIFQWEGTTGDRYIKKLMSDENIRKFKSVNENIDKMTLLSIGNSAIRPAGASYRDDLANGIVRKSGSQAIDDFLKPTFGYLVFQCQIIEFLHSYCGFTMGEADIVRRHFAKKTGTEADIPIIKDGGYMIGLDGNPKTDHYIPGFIATMKQKYGMVKEESEKAIVNFLQVIIDASNYLFSLNHSQPYSYEGYACGWLRYYYPLEFLTTALNINKDNEEKTTALLYYAQKQGICIKAPRYGYSKGTYFFDKSSNAIYKGVGSIKFMNNMIGDELYEISKERHYSFIELLTTINDRTSMDSRMLEILIRINYFSDYGEVNKLLRLVEFHNEIYGKKNMKKDKAIRLGISDEVMQKYASESPKTWTKLDGEGLLNELKDTVEYEPETVKQRLDSEHDILGILSEVRPNYDKRIYYVNHLNRKKSVTNVSIYEIFSGQTREVRIWTSSFDRLPFEEKDMIRIAEITRQNKKEASDEINPTTGKKIWKPIPDQYEFWLKRYSVITGDLA